MVSTPYNVDSHHGASSRTRIRTRSHAGVHLFRSIHTPDTFGKDTTCYESCVLNQREFVPSSTRPCPRRDPTCKERYAVEMLLISSTRKILSSPSAHNKQSDSHKPSFVARPKAHNTFLYRLQHIVSPLCSEGKLPTALAFHRLSASAWCSPAEE